MIFRKFPIPGTTISNISQSLSVIWIAIVALSALLQVIGEPFWQVLMYIFAPAPPILYGMGCLVSDWKEYRGVGMPWLFPALTVVAVLVDFSWTHYTGILGMVLLMDGFINFMYDK